MKKLISIFVLTLAVAGCSGNSYYDDGKIDESQVDESQVMESDADYQQIDSYRPKTDEEKEINQNRWNTSRMETRWQDYKGKMVRVQILLDDIDTRQMRLRLMQNADGGDIDADNETVLARVADFEMKRVCGKNATGIIVVYDEPAFDSMRPTPYFDYRIEAEGSSMREYGFRCTYNK